MIQEDSVCAGLLTGWRKEEEKLTLGELVDILTMIASRNFEEVEKYMRQGLREGLTQLE
jgi:DNA-binding GntR family transcriptional regulator